jgi:hypothetical protein
MGQTTLSNVQYTFPVIPEHFNLNLDYLQVFFYFLTSLQVRTNVKVKVVH